LVDKKKTTRLVINFDDDIDLYEDLRKLAFETHPLSMNEHVRRALREYIEKTKKS